MGNAIGNVVYVEFSRESERTTGQERWSKQATVLAPKISRIGSLRRCPFHGRAVEFRLMIYILLTDLRTSAALSASLSLLAKAQERITQATEQIKPHNPVAADDSIQRFQASLPELFCCRTLRDGFGAVINAVLLSLQNSEGEPLNERQIDAIGRALQKQFEMNLSCRSMPRCKSSKN